MKKIIIIAMSPLGNPVSDYYNFLADAFIRNNFKVIFIFDGVSPERIERFQLKSGSKLTLFWPSKRPTKYKDFIFLFKLIKKERPVMCLSNFGSTNVVSLVSFLYGIKNRINYIHTTTKQIFLDSTKNNFEYLFFQYRKKLVYNLNTSFFTNSNGTKEDTIKTYNIPNKKIKVFPLLIKTSTIPYRIREEREYCITIVGRLNKSKGHKQLLYMFKKSLLLYPKLKLKIIGDGSLKEELIELAKSLKICKSIIFTGKISYDKIGEIFSNSLINISSSLDEAYGLVNIEALREGTPIICTVTAGSLDILKPEYNGLYMYHENKDSLTNMITIIFSNWEFYSKNAIKTFESNYSMKNIDRQSQMMINYFN